MTKRPKSSLINSCLDELLAGHRPPDLSDRILRNLECDETRVVKSQVVVDHLVSPPPRAARAHRRTSRHVAGWCVALAMSVAAILVSVRTVLQHQPQDSSFALKNKHASRSIRPSKRAGTPTYESPAIRSSNPRFDTSSERRQTDSVATDTRSNDTSALAGASLPWEQEDAGKESNRDAPDRDRAGTPWEDQQIVALINRRLQESWDNAGVEPALPVSREAWFRRLVLRTLGRNPTTDEIQQLSDIESWDHPTQLLDHIFESDEYLHGLASHWGKLWARLLVGEPDLGAGGQPSAEAQGLERYLVRALSQGRPFDEVVSEMLTVVGSNDPNASNFNPAANFLIACMDDQAQAITSKTSQVFLGKRLQCAKCHPHPFSDLAQVDFWQMNAFFQQVRVRRDPRTKTHSVVDRDFPGQGKKPSWNDAEVFYEDPNGIVRAAYPVFIDGTAISRSGRVAVANRRAELARILTQSPDFAAAVVNRVWASCFGYGFTNPVDDMGPHNSPSHPELLAELAEQFVSHRYDIPRLIRWLVCSDAFHLSSTSSIAASLDNPPSGSKPLFSRYYTRQTESEPVFASMLAMIGESKSLRNAQVDSNSQKWLGQFQTDPDRDVGDGNVLVQRRYLRQLEAFRGRAMRRALAADQTSLLRRVADSDMKYTDQVRHVFWASLSRDPTRREAVAAKRLLSANDGDRAGTLQDMWWALVNSHEYVLYD